MKTQRQVKLRSGTAIHPNLDDISLQALITSQDEHRRRGGNFSQSVLVRRALRFYCRHMKDCGDYGLEEVETMRAAKGIH